MRKRSYIGLADQVRSGYWKVTTILLIFIVWIMGEEGKYNVFIEEG
jgi:hypothetical protein